eukprot:TRINITY_DN3556_c0_g2_i3.p1 TRINITY_DN3556_c0_g2~~TRINITY_DN3556_c0_g2_i3.p1  ORF type:complete len:1976 (-),score=412.77 TRINITY_DN3556_c0_g2_i3:1002-6929(-)
MSRLGGKKPQAVKRWVSEPVLGYVIGEEDRSNSEVVHYVNSHDEQRDIPRDKTFPVEPSDTIGVPDNTHLVYLHEAGMLNNIRHRYFQDNIYTYTGYILIAVNPYKPLPIYSNEHVRQYFGRHLGSQPPHVFAIADRAYRNLKTDKCSQSILISGESGAGKTETSKHVMKFLVNVGGSHGEKMSAVEERILQSNPILEAFGNAKTPRNNNSSRFGKFIQIRFNKAFQVCGANIVTYLLEKSRLIVQSPGNRNYHIFYQLIAGATPAEKVELKLTSAKEFHYLAQGGDPRIDGVDDAADFQAVRNALRAFGVDDNQQRQIYRLLAGLLHLGNIEFVANSGRDDSCKIKDEETFQIAADLLSVDPNILMKSLLNRSVTAGTSKVEVPLKLSEANYSRDALAKTMYEQLFLWIVGKINALLSDDVEGSLFIGILDIFGFESFDKNSFEQLCINYANEKLQQQFNQQIFKSELDVYRLEGIKAPEVHFIDNQACLDLMEKPVVGVFGLLDEQCRLPKPSDSSFTGAVYLKNPTSAHLLMPKTSAKSKRMSLRADEAFVIKHYAGEVCYSTIGFVDKNNDNVNTDLLAVCFTSSNQILRQLAFTQDDAAQSGRSDRRTTGDAPNKRNKESVGSQFYNQLKALIQTLNKTSCHFIRCIKPNMAQKPQQFTNTNVMEQLRCNGMVDALTLMHAGYPTRCPYADLYERFKSIMPASLCKLKPPIFTEALVMALECDRQDFQLGLSKIFFRSGKLAFLEELRGQGDAKIDPALIVKIQKYLARKMFRKAIWTTRSILRMQRRIVQMRRFKVFLKITRIVKRVCVKLVRISRRVRRVRAATCIQKYYRRFVDRSNYQKLRSSAIIVQSLVRRYLAIRKYRPQIEEIKKRRTEEEIRIQKEKAAEIKRQEVLRKQKQKEEMERLKREEEERIIRQQEEKRRREEYEKEQERLRAEAALNAMIDSRAQVQVDAAKKEFSVREAELIGNINKLESDLNERAQLSKGELEKLQAEIQRAQNDLEKEKDARQKEHQAMESKVKSLNQHHETMEKKWKENVDEVQNKNKALAHQLQEEKNSRAKEQETNTAKVQELEAIISEAKVKIANLRKSFEEKLKEVTQTHEQALATKTTEAQSLEARLLVSQEQITTLKQLQASEHETNTKRVQLLEAQIKELIAEKTQDSETSNKKIDLCNRELEELKRLYQILLEENQMLKAQVEDLSHQLKDSKIEKDKLKYELDATKQELLDTKEALTRLQGDHQHIRDRSQKEIDTHVQRTQELLLQNQAYATKIESMEERHSVDIDGLNATIQQREIEFQRLSIRYNEASAENNRLKEKLDSISASLGEKSRAAMLAEKKLTENKLDLDTEKDRLDTQKSMLEKQVASLQSTLKDTTANMIANQRRLEDEVNTLQSQLKNLQFEKSIMQQKVDSSKIEADRYRAESERQISARKSALTELAVATEELEASRSKVSELQRELRIAKNSMGSDESDHVEHIRRLQAYQDNLKAEIENLQKEVISSQEAHTKAEQEYESARQIYENNISKLQLEKSLTESSLSRMQDIIMDLQDTLRHSQKQLEEEMNARLRDQEEFVMEKAKLERKSQQLLEQQSRESSAQEKVERRTRGVDLSEHHQDLEQQVASLSAKNNALNDKIKDLQSALATAQKRVTDDVREISSDKKKLEIEKNVMAAELADVSQKAKDYQRIANENRQKLEEHVRSTSRDRSEAIQLIMSLEALVKSQEGALKKRDSEIQDYILDLDDADEEIEYLKQLLDSQNHTAGGQADEGNQAQINDNSQTHAEYNQRVRQIEEAYASKIRQLYVLRITLEKRINTAKSDLCESIARLNRICATDRLEHQTTQGLSQEILQLMVEFEAVQQSLASGLSAEEEEALADTFVRSILDENHQLRAKVSEPVSKEVCKQLELIDHRFGAIKNAAQDTLVRVQNMNEDIAKPRSTHLAGMKKVHRPNIYISSDSCLVNHYILCHT